MEDDRRPFQAVNIGMESVETGRERFTVDGILQFPPRAFWRNNLTALSQHYNLYFIASTDNICVYQPGFPFQKLKQNPKLRIPPSLANPRAQGYIDPRNPHIINHLTVGDLGTEEILLVTTDSGNIAAYYTKSIKEAIKKDPYSFSADGRSDYVGLRPFFNQWVYESAWGLAIHQAGRMIAVSANTAHHVRTDDHTAKITVFAFALSDERSSAKPEQNGRPHVLEAEDSEWHMWEGNHLKGNSPRRDRNYKITLAGHSGHTNNIPSISFVNTDEDPEGSWLLSTDIGGEMKLWQIWQAKCYKDWNFTDSSSPHAPWIRQREGGWLVAALDPLAFRTATSMEQFCGHSKAPQYYGHAGESYDITQLVRNRTPGNSSMHPFNQEASDDSDDSEIEEEIIQAWSDPENFDDDMQIGPSSRTARHESQIDIQRVNEDAEMQLQFSETQSLTDHADSLDGNLDRPREYGDTALALGVHTDEVAALLENSVLPGSDSDDMSDVDGETQFDNVDGLHSVSDELENGSSTRSHNSGTSISSLTHRESAEMEEARDLVEATLTPQSLSGRSSSRKTLQKPADQSSTQLRIPFVPTIHCTNSHLRLLYAPQAQTPHIFCAHMLKQILPAALEEEGFNHFDRLNMMQQIPELGIIIIATQVGRCAILSLTRKGPSGLMGLRVDWILPTKRQERKQLRPTAPLLGIAVGPIQGRMMSKSAFDVENEFKEAWATDRVVDGIETKFDPDVFVLSSTLTRDDEVQSEKNKYHRSSFTENIGPGSQSSQDSILKRKRASSSSQTSSSGMSIITQRPWLKSAEIEPWRAAENSRRYRLMMTYADMTVLTYEISRGVERDDFAVDADVSDSDVTT